MKKTRTKSASAKDKLSNYKSEQQPQINGPTSKSKSKRKNDNAKASTKQSTKSAIKSKKTQPRQDKTTSEPVRKKSSQGKKTAGAKNATSKQATKKKRQPIDSSPVEMAKSLEPITKKPRKQSRSKTNEQEKNTTKPKRRAPAKDKNYAIPEPNASAEETKSKRRRRSESRPVEMTKTLELEVKKVRKRTKSKSSAGEENTSKPKRQRQPSVHPGDITAEVPEPDAPTVNTWFQRGRSQSVSVKKTKSLELETKKLSKRSNSVSNGQTNSSKSTGQSSTPLKSGCTNSQILERDSSTASIPENLHQPHCSSRIKTEKPSESHEIQRSYSEASTSTAASASEDSKLNFTTSMKYSTPNQQCGVRMPEYCSKASTSYASFVSDYCKLKSTTPMQCKSPNQQYRCGIRRSSSVASTFSASSNSISDNSEVESISSIGSLSYQQYRGAKPVSYEFGRNVQPGGLLATYPVLSLPLKKRPSRDGALSWDQSLRLQDFYTYLRERIKLARQQREGILPTCPMQNLPTVEETSTSRNGVKSGDQFLESSNYKTWAKAGHEKPDADAASDNIQS